MQGGAPILAVGWRGTGVRRNARFALIRSILTRLGRRFSDEEIIQLYKDALASWNDESPQTNLTWEDLLKLPLQEQGFFAYGAYCYGKAKASGNPREWWVSMARWGHRGIDREGSSYTQWVLWLNHKHKRG